jgi:hypothetical protein
MDQSEPASRQRTTAIIAAAGLACLAIAIPVSGAFADGDGNGGNTSGTTPAQSYGSPGYGQPPTGQGQRQAPDRNGAPDGRNCPKDHQGNPPSNGGQQNNEGSSGTALPGDSVAL